MAVRCYSTGESMAVVMIHPQCLSQVGRGWRKRQYNGGEGG